MMSAMMALQMVVKESGSSVSVVSSVSRCSQTALHAFSMMKTSSVSGGSVSGLISQAVSKLAANDPAMTAFFP
jgi:hypothetical protein